MSTGFVLIAFYHALLGGWTNIYDMHLQDRRLVRYESGRLVARSQVDFYKIEEQWVPPEGRNNHGSLRKERLIEDRHVIREAIEYRQNENEHEANVAQRHSKLLNSSSLNEQKSDVEAQLDSLRKRGEWKKHRVASSDNRKAFDLLDTNKSAQNGSMASAKTNENTWPQQVMIQETNHELVADEKNGLQLDEHALIDDSSSNSSQVSAYATKVRSSELGNVKKLSFKPSAEKLEFDNVHVQPSVKTQDGKQRPSFESTRTMLQPVAYKNSTHTEPPTQHYKKYDVEYQNTMKFRAKHQPISESTQMDSHIARPYIGSRKESTEPHAQSSSKRDLESYNATHNPVNQTASEPAERDSLLGSSKHSVTNVVRRESRIPHVQPSVILGSETENVVHIQPKQQLAAESSRMKSRDASKIVTRNKAYKPQSNPVAKVKRTGENPPKMIHVISAGGSYGQSREVRVHGSEHMSKDRNLAVPPQYIGNNGNRELENTDSDLDQRYAHLPESVKKKLAQINKDRAQRMKFLRLITKRCDGHKYCLFNVKPNERYLHNKCFYQAIQLENEGTELSTCQCRLFRIPVKEVHGRRVYTNATLPRVALVSLPGSGNTWVRGLLEQATGYCTGSMWCDPMLRAKQFCAEGIRSNTLVIKNHDPTIRWDQQRLPVNASHKGITNMNKPTFNSAIFVHRNPYEATIAEWNRALGSKVNNATKHNQTVAGIGFYDVSDLKNQHTVSFGEEAFGMLPTLYVHFGIGGGGGGVVEPYIVLITL